MYCCTIVQSNPAVMNLIVCLNSRNAFLRRISKNKIILKKITYFRWERFVNHFALDVWLKSKPFFTTKKNTNLTILKTISVWSGTYMYCVTNSMQTLPNPIEYQNYTLVKISLIGLFLTWWSVGKQFNLITIGSWSTPSRYIKRTCTGINHQFVVGVDNMSTNLVLRIFVFGVVSSVSMMEAESSPFLKVSL